MDGSVKGRNSASVAILQSDQGPLGWFSRINEDRTPLQAELEAISLAASSAKDKGLANLVSDCKIAVDVIILQKPPTGLDSLVFLFLCSEFSFEVREFSDFLDQ